MKQRNPTILWVRASTIERNCLQTLKYELASIEGYISYRRKEFQNFKIHELKKFIPESKETIKNSRANLKGF